MTHSSRSLFLVPPRPGITRLAERTVYRNQYAAVYDDDVRFTAAHTGRYLRVVQSGGQPHAVAIPLAPGPLAGLVRVYRYPVGEWEWGFPRGIAHGGDPAATAAGELAEELGAHPVRLTELGWMWPDSGILATAVCMFAATYEHMPAAPLDTAEVDAVRWVSVDGLRAGIAGGKISDGFTLAVAGVALCRGLL